MDLDKQEQIRRVLRQLAANYSAAMKMMEQVLGFMEEELSLEQTPPKGFRARLKNQPSSRLEVDRSALSVTSRGRSCFLGNTLMFRLIEQLAKHRNKYVPYEDLLADVWQCDLYRCLRLRFWNQLIAPRTAGHCEAHGVAGSTWRAACDT